jgi:hypothetical protein
VDRRKRRAERLTVPVGELVGPEGPKLMAFVCLACGRKMKALPSAEIRCLCGQMMRREDEAC